MIKTARNEVMNKSSSNFSNTEYGVACNRALCGRAFNSGKHGTAFNIGYLGEAVNCGRYGAAFNIDFRGEASTTGKQSAAIHCGYKGKVLGVKGCALFLAERDDEYKIINVWSGIVGENGVKPETWYSLKNGQLVEVEKNK